MAYSLTRTSRLAAVIALALVGVLGVAGQAIAAVSSAGGLGVDTVEPPASLQKGIAIEKNEVAAGNNPTVVYSVGLSDFAASEHIRIAASVYGSYCAEPDIYPNWFDGGNGNPGSPCIGAFWKGTPQSSRKPTYPIWIKARVYLSDAFRGKSGGLNIKEHSEAFCDYYKHHCPVRVALDRAIADPYPADPALYVNVEVMAWANNSNPWQSGDLLELEGDCYDPAIQNENSYANCLPVVGNVAHPDPQKSAFLAGTMGQLSVLRFGSTIESPAPLPSYTDSTINAANVKVGVDDGPQVVHSTKVGNLRAGDVLEAHARGVDVQGVGFDHALETWWVLGSSKTATRPHSGSYERYVSPKDAINCLDSNPNNRSLNGNFSGECTTSQRGAVRVPSGFPANQPMWLNYVAEATDGHTPPTLNNPRAEFKGGDFDLTCDPLVTAPSCTFTAER